MDKTSVKVEFTIIGDELIPKNATEKLKITPNQFWQEGEDIKGRQIKRKDTCWSINTGYEESNDINEQLFKIVGLLQDKKNILKELKSIHNLEYIFAIVVNIENNEKPEMYFNREFIKFANDIDAEFYIDMYIYS